MNRKKNEGRDCAVPIAYSSAESAFLTGLREAHRPVIVVIVFLAFFASLGETHVRAQENTVSVVFEKDAARQTVIGVFRHHGIFYGSLTDLAQVFGLQTYENPTNAKLELKQGPYRIKVTGGSPFIVVMDQAQRQTVYQLPANVIYVSKSFFVPLQSFIPFFELVFDKNARYDRERRTIFVGGPAALPGFDIPAVAMESKANGFVIHIPSRKKIQDMESWLRQDGWLYVTLVDVKADVKAINATKPTGPIRRVVAIQSPRSVQLTFLLTGKIETTELVRSDESNNIMVVVRTPMKNEEAVVPPPKSVRTAPADLEDERKRWALDVIVIDPGHGGRDPGTIGVTGVKEKTVTLGVATKLGKILKKTMPDVRVEFTRDGDEFVPLYRRGQIANERGGKLFISIHANAMPRKPHSNRGFEVYLLRPGRTEEAVAIAERENSVIELEEGTEDQYKELTEENFILVTMAQSAYVRSSEVLADLVQKKMERVAGLPNRGVRQAGFYVLVGAAMPNILVETAYLSNREDEKFLKSSSGQQKIAESLAKAIEAYRVEYEKLLSEGGQIGGKADRREEILE